MKVELTDSGKFSSTVITDEGFLVTEIDFARVGIQQYLNSDLADGKFFPDKPKNAIINVLRPESEVFDEKSLSSFALIPLTNGHPDKNLDSKTTKYYSVGTTGENVKRNGNFVRTKIKVTDSIVVNKIKSGYKQFSAGYTSILKKSNGIYGGKEFHAIQTNIRGNHLAVAINNARCGDGCSIKDNNNMKTEQILGTIKIELSDELRTAITDSLATVETEFAELSTKITDAEAKVVVAEAKVADIQELWDECKKKKQDELDELSAQLDDAKSKILDQAAIDAIIETRVKTIHDCVKILPSVDCKLPNFEMKKAVVLSACSDLKDIIDLKSEPYIDGRLEGLLASPILDSLNLGGKKKDENKPELVDSQAKRKEVNNIKD